MDEGESTEWPDDDTDPFGDSEPEQKPSSATISEENLGTPEEDSKEETEATFKTEWHLTKVGRNEKKTNETHQKIFSSNSTQELKLLLRGTQFQVQIWQALLNIPFGAVSNYENLAAATGKISATRPAASAIAKNKIAYLIPCHRVIRKNGESGEFRWGKNKKKILLN